MVVNLEELFNAEKTFSIRPDWKKSANDGWLRLVVPLDIDGVTVEGLRLGMYCRQSMPDQSVTLQVEYFPPKRSAKGGPLCRIEWRPMRPHNNKGMGPQEFQFLPISGCHHHSFDLNWRHAQRQVQKGGLPIAVPIGVNLTTFDEVLAFAGNEFRIKDLASVSPPPWEKNLL